MATLLAKLLFLLIGLYTAFMPVAAWMTNISVGWYNTEPQVIVALLLAVTISALLQYYASAKATAIGIGLFSAICFFLPAGIYFFPLLTIDLTLSTVQAHEKHYQKRYLILLMPVFVAWQQSGRLLWLILVMTLAFLSGYLLKQVKLLSNAYIALQDSHTEQSLTLHSKNRELLESQNEVAGMATLQERTRIARDIHDNVGHILVRGILLTGVLKTANKTPALAEPIETIESTLKEAMDTIRAAVHDWKDEAIDLRDSVEKLSASTTLDVDLHYDISEQMPTDIKLCFLMIIKEALTNVTKHSSATKVRINLQEHPSLYQLLIKDNGNAFARENISSESAVINYGMGLSNIKERISALGGTCSFERRNGFRIFVSIPISASK